jgi:hypothetical protein
MQVTLTPATKRQIEYLTNLLERKARVEILRGDPMMAMAIREQVADLIDRRIIISRIDASRMIDRTRAWLARQ